MKIYEKFQQYIFDKYKEFIWKTPELKNKCNEMTFELNNTQKFLSEYYTPGEKDGMLLWWSVGSGKTLGAVKLLHEFEKKGYNTLWVTRTTLRKDIEKALTIIPLKKQLNTFSYKQFSNICKRKGENFNRLLNKAKKQNPLTNDPLYKTIIIIDEAHKLYSTDLKQQELHSIKDIEKGIWNSYKSSDGCKVILMTGTVITSDPMDCIKLLNLLITSPDRRFNTGTFYGEFLDDSGKFTPQGMTKFREITMKIVSYINLTAIPSNFAKVNYTEVLIPLSSPGLACKEQLKYCITDCDAKMKECEKKLKAPYQTSMLVKKCKIRIN